MRCTQVLVAVVLLLGFGLEARALEEARVSKVDPLPFLPDSPYAAVTVEYPPAMGDPAVEVAVNGTVPAFRILGGGSRSDGPSERDLEVALGEPGKKDLKVTLQWGGTTLEATKTIDWKPNASVLFLGLVDGVAVFSPAPIRFSAFLVRNLGVTVNGREARAVKDSATAAPGPQIWQVEPPFRPGTNTIAVSGEDSTGKTVARSFTFYFAADRKVRRNDTFELDYGVVGSRSGPFYELAIDSDAVEAVSRSSTNLFFLDDAGWIDLTERLVARLRAKDTGTAKVRIRMRTFLQDWQPVEEVSLTVLP